MIPDQKTVNEFHRVGVACLRNVIDERWRSKVAEAIERDISDPGPFFHNYEVKTGRFHGNSVCWLRHPEFADYSFDSPLPEIAAVMLRSNKVNLLYDQLFIKEPGTDTPTPWHHDHCVWPLQGKQVISFWLALDTVDASTGRVEFVKGSHEWEGLFQPYQFVKGGPSFEIDPRFRPMPDIEAERDKFEIVSWNLEPGDVLAFSSRTVHGAGGNHSSTTRRRGYTVRYCGDDVTYDTSHQFPPWLRNPDIVHGDPLDSDLFPLVRRDGKKIPRPPSSALERFLKKDQVDRTSPSGKSETSRHVV